MFRLPIKWNLPTRRGDGQIKVNIIPINLTDEDVDNIVAFFHSLEGVKPTIEYPQLPKYRD